MPRVFGHHVAYVALGSNLGDRAWTLRGAVDAMREIQGIRVDAISRLIETIPVGGPPGQGNYLNGAMRLITSCAPEDLLSILQEIELRFDRRRSERWAPRTLDLDLLLYDDAVIETERLTVPHPRMHERGFVLRPLCEIAPDVVHPVLRKTVQDLLRGLPCTDQPDPLL